MSRIILERILKMHEMVKKNLLFHVDTIVIHNSISHGGDVFPPVKNQRGGHLFVFPPVKIPREGHNFVSPR